MKYIMPGITFIPKSFFSNSGTYNLITTTQIFVDKHYINEHFLPLQQSVRLKEWAQFMTIGLDLLVSGAVLKWPYFK